MSVVRLGHGSCYKSIVAIERSAFLMYYQVQVQVATPKVQENLQEKGNQKKKDGVVRAKAQHIFIFSTLFPSKLAINNTSQLTL